MSIIPYSDNEKMIDYLNSNHVDTLREKNKKLLSYLQELIVNNKIGIINELVNNEIMLNLHLSLLKSMLIMYENNIEINTVKLQEVYKIKFNNSI